MTARRALLCPLALLLAAAACDRADARERRPVAQRPPEHVDSAVPRAEEVRRFRDGLAPAAALTGGAATAGALVRQFASALERRDSAGFAPMLLSRAEFAWLYYDTSPIAHPPYDLSPGLMWFQMQGHSAKGLGHALEERGGRPLGYVGFSCDPPVRQGQNLIHGNCLVRRIQAPGDTVTEALFGALIQRNGRFKFLSYANHL
jgi:hypothetical protein